MKFGYANDGWLAGERSLEFRPGKRQPDRLTPRKETPAPWRPQALRLRSGL